MLCSVHGLSMERPGCPACDQTIDPGSAVLAVSAMTFDNIVTFLARLSLVLLFLPFSALDKILNFDLAKQQARTLVDSAAVAKALIVAGVFVEIVMPLGVLTGVADRLAAFVLAGYCVVTALLWKRFWQQPGFKLVGKSPGREV